ncbi:hypothetical protein PS2_010386 [Malus domestica]
MTSLLLPLPLPLLVTSDAATGGSGEVAASPVARLGLNLPSVAELQRPTALYSETEASAAPAGQAPGGGGEWVVVVEVEVGVWGQLGSSLESTTEVGLLSVGSVSKAEKD